LKRKVYIRVDGNSSVGFGHVYRGLAIAQNLNAHFKVEFISKNSIDIIVSPFKNYLLHDTSEIEQMRKIAPENSIIILDGYQFTSDYQKDVKSIGYKLVYVDDLRSEYMYADLVINHTPGIVATDYMHELYTQFALGVEYAMLRPEFIEKAQEAPRKFNDIKNVFITFGGADRLNLTRTMTQQCLESNRFDNIFVLSGNDLPQDPRVKRLSSLSAIELIQTLENVQLVIVPSSNIFYEICCLSVPCITGYFVENQKSIYNYAEQFSLGYLVGDFTKVINLNFDFLDDKVLLHAMVTNQYKEFTAVGNPKLVKLLLAL
jgi:UDP-2,4-diacetamido-2,4,6-trideoxy-beta-L-altropyranose hydrolase